MFLDFFYFKILTKEKNLFLDFFKIKKSIFRFFILLKSKNRKNLKIDFYWTSLDIFFQTPIYSG